MVKVKICGITNYQDAKDSIDFGADAIGFIFYNKSQRYIKPEDARNIIKKFPPFVISVGVFVNSEYRELEDICSITGVNIVQLHGDEKPPFIKKISRNVIKTIRVSGENSVKDVKKFQVSAILLDTYRKEFYGGTGETFDWNIALKIKKFNRIILSGGLNPDNVIEAVDKVKPYGVDVCSGVEIYSGKKHLEKLRSFLERVKSYG